MSSPGLGAGSKRTYENALKLLDTRRRRARPQHAGALLPPRTAEPPSSEPRSSLRGTPSLTGMRDWLQQIGYSDGDVAALNIIHVAGTKGKGSTCAFARALLHEHGQRTGFPAKVGLYTSPDLTCIRERIQIDGRAISEALFTRYFFEIWDCLFPPPPGPPGLAARQPRFLQLLALLAIHTFSREGTHAAIFETHHGGEYDATNVVAAPVVTGITSIGLDHLAQLGPDIEHVAWHKAGIFKPGAPAFAAPQAPAVEAVLRSRAQDRGVPLAMVPVDPRLPRDAPALRPPVQQINCSLAIALVDAFLARHSPGADDRLSQRDIERAVQHFSWPGRFEVRQTARCTWYVDGAHNELSIGQAVDWFADMTTASDREAGRTPTPWMVIFSHVSEERDGRSLLRALARALERNGIRQPDMVFTTYQERRDGTIRADKTLKPPEDAVAELPQQYEDLWRSIDPAASTTFVPSIEEALERADDTGLRRGRLHVLVTGSLHLVGGALYLLQRWIPSEH